MQLFQASVLFLPFVASTLSQSTTPVSADVDVQFDGRSFVNRGLVGFGRIDPSLVDSHGETLGGLGSAIALESFSPNNDGTYQAIIRLNPDRGHNTQTTTDYRARSHTFNLSFDPSRGGPTEENVHLSYKSSILYRYAAAGNNFTTGLDPLSVRKGSPSTPPLPQASSNGHISFDAEGFAFSKDGNFFFVSDEYGPYIYLIETKTGLVVNSIQPPNAIVPRIGGKINFTSEQNPETGRAANQGFEGLTLDTSTNTLWVLLQSATMQDSKVGGSTTIRYTRLFGYDVSNLFKPTLEHEYVVPLPLSKEGKTRKCSELHAIDSTTFLILPRDSNGYGDTDSDSSFKHADLISTKKATDIANSKYDDPANPIAPGGVLESGISPTSYASFVDLVDPTQLAKFGLHSRGKFDQGLIASKLESLAVAPAKENGNYFLLVCSDNDFITATGHQAAEIGQKYVLQDYQDPYALQYGSQAIQFFIYSVTLPGYSQGLPFNR